jgi:hypothetical protein
MYDDYAIENMRRQRELARAILYETKDLDGAQWVDEQYRAEFFERVSDMGRELANQILELDDYRMRGGLDPYARKGVR